MITVELHELSLYGYHGATAEEQEEGQTFLFDVDYDVAAGSLTDRLEDTVDYRHVVALIREISDGRRFDLVETLAATIADAILVRFPVQRVRVRVRKPDVSLGAPVAWTGASVERRR